MQPPYYEYPWPIEESGPRSTTSGSVGFWHTDLYKSKFYGDLAPGSFEYIRKSNKLYSEILHKQTPFCEDSVKPYGSSLPVRIPNCQDRIRSLNVALPDLSGTCKSNLQTKSIAVIPMPNSEQPSRDRIRQLDWRCFGVRHHRQKLRQLSFAPSNERTDRTFEIEYQIPSVPQHKYSSIASVIASNSFPTVIQPCCDQSSFIQQTELPIAISPETNTHTSLSLDLSFLKSSTASHWSQQKSKSSVARSLHEAGGRQRNQNIIDAGPKSKLLNKTLSQYAAFGLVLPNDES